MRLNLGAGSSPIEGYDNSWDTKQDKQAYPLQLEDSVADEIRASHILEHFNHRGVGKVVADWVRVLRPGGLMRIAVPDLEKIASAYVAGEPGNYQGWISGGQVDGLDIHLTQFDQTSLSALLRSSGLVGIHRWKGEGDCSALPISLNLAGWKRPESWPRTAAVMSTPRLGFMDMFACACEALMPLGIDILRRTGVFWGQALTHGIEDAISQGYEWIFTVDYDSIFTRQNVEDLMMLAYQNPDADALVPVQMNRLKNLVLMRPKGASLGRYEMDLREWDATYWPISSGHFGCSLIRASAFEKLSRPWFHSAPDAEGRWGLGHIDDDPWFWKRFEDAGCQAFLAPRVVIGHCENMIIWPDHQLNAMYQHPNDWWEKGAPRGVWR